MGRQETYGGAGCVVGQAEGDADGIRVVFVVEIGAERAALERVESPGCDGLDGDDGEGDADGRLESVILEGATEKEEDGCFEEELDERVVELFDELILWG